MQICIKHFTHKTFTYRIKSSADYICDIDGANELQILLGRSFSLIFIAKVIFMYSVVKSKLINFSEAKEEKAVEEKVEQQEQTGNIGSIYLIDQANNIGE